MKILTSFKLPQMTKQNLKYLATKHQISQAEIIEIMSDYFTDKDDYDFSMQVEAFKIRKKPQFKKFEAIYEQASLEQQKVMCQMFLENRSMLD